MLDSLEFGTIYKYMSGREQDTTHAMLAEVSQFWQYIDFDDMSSPLDNEIQLKKTTFLD